MPGAAGDQVQLEGWSSCSCGCGHYSNDLTIACLQVLYLTQLAIWCYTCFVHRFVDVRRKDYYVMYVHHVITIALVTGSASAG
jgi:TLC domain